MGPVMQIVFSHPSSRPEAVAAIRDTSLPLMWLLGESDSLTSPYCTRSLMAEDVEVTALKWNGRVVGAYGSNVNGAIGSNTGNTVGGVSVDTLVTDFGRLNVVVERALPKDCIFAASAEQVHPVFLNVPGKGVLFEEQLAKTGSADKTMLYGEIGLAYGSQTAHGVLRGLAVA